MLTVNSSTSIPGFYGLLDGACRYMWFKQPLKTASSWGMEILLSTIISLVNDCMSIFHTHTHTYIYISKYIDMQNNKWLEVKYNDGSFDKTPDYSTNIPCQKVRRTQILKWQNKELGGGFNYLFSPRNFAEDSHWACFASGWFNPWTTN